MDDDKTRWRWWWRWIAGAIPLLLAVTAFVGWRFYEPGWRYGVKGVDVSHHQGAIDWVALAADDVDFAYIKATEGGDWLDLRFEENWVESYDAGVVRGAYHYFTLCRPGAEQAQNFIDVVPVEAGMLPPAVDLEFAGNCAHRPEVQAFLAELGDFLDIVGEHYGTPLLAYTNSSFYEAYLAPDPPQVIWWINSPVLKPRGDPDWSFWQYFPGRREGVDGEIDRNVYRGSPEELRLLLLPASG